MKKSIVMLTSATLLMSSFSSPGFAAESNSTKSTAPINQQTNTGDYYATYVHEKRSSKRILRTRW